VKYKLTLLACIFSIVVTGISSGADISLPHRTKYKDVPVVEIEDVPARLESAWIIDVRSKYEFETLHIKGAINVPLGDIKYGKKLKALLEKEDKPIIFYCNGGTCKKSYKALLKARKYGLDNTSAYDAGIYNWANRYPKHSVLLGKHPMQAGQFISNKTFKARLINAETFKGRRKNNAVVLDIRDYAQRDNPLFPFEEERAQLKDISKIKRLVQNVKKTKKTLLVYDKVGKQVRWFQYFLEKEGVKNYYFMKGGSEGYFQETLGFETFKKHQKS
jgi:rhodanese-related sulfurtransferase